MKVPNSHLLFIAFILLWFSSARLNAAEKLRISYPTLGPGFTPSWVTAEAGFWKKQGLDVELVLLSGLLDEIQQSGFTERLYKQ